MIWAVISTVVATLASMMACCCLPLGLPSGIAAIVYASKVNPLLAAENEIGAMEASRKAKMWCWVTTILGSVFLILVVLSFVLQMLGVVNEDYLEDLKRQIEAGRH
ncbi:hypothetical protein N789_13755 [Arenimonas oryziterrae DSM 21050 = YC6267]|uniref:CD225/dispanin family protein n=2 Tax=Arenimonas TaxID=490567 RepID=A0A091ATC4_9GAMM|nr:hypothetical protein N789_13755 [Arenimonas oryziterrae DSM 21050 = YC6267]